MTGNSSDHGAVEHRRLWTTIVGLVMVAAAFVALAPSASSQSIPDDCRDVGSSWTCENVPPTEEGCRAVFAEEVCERLPVDSSREEQCQATPEATTRLCWSSRLDEASYGMSIAIDEPDTASETSTVFVASGTTSPGSWSYEFLVTAYDGETGEVLWQTEGGPGTTLAGLPSEIAVDPAGETVAVTSMRGGTGLYDATTGEILWPNDRGSKDTSKGLRGQSLVFGPDGDQLFVGEGGFFDEAIGLNAVDTTNASEASVTWIARDVSVDEDDGIDVHPDGSHVYAIEDEGVVALDTEDGTRAWTHPVTSRLVSLQVGPNGEGVYALGASGGFRTTSFQTLGIDAASGRTTWEATFGESARDDSPADITVGPLGTQVYVTGSSEQPHTSDDEHHSGAQNDVVTVAYDAASGVEHWVDRYDGPGEGDRAGDWAMAIDVSPSGQQVYAVAGSCSASGQSGGEVEGFCSDGTYDYATIAINAGDGEQAWVERYDGFRQAEWPEDVAVDPTGARVYVTGGSQVDCENDSRYECGFRAPYQTATLAYGTRDRPDSLSELLDFPGETICRDLPRIVKTVRVAGGTTENLLGETVPLPDQVKRILVRPAFHCDPTGGGGGGSGQCGETVAEQENTSVRFGENHNARPTFGEAHARTCVGVRSQDAPDRSDTPENGSLLADDLPGPLTNETNPFVDHRGVAVYFHEQRCKASTHQGMGLNHTFYRERYVVTC